MYFYIRDSKLSRLTNGRWHLNILHSFLFSSLLKIEYPENKKKRYTLGSRLYIRYKQVYVSVKKLKQQLYSQEWPLNSDLFPTCLLLLLSLRSLWSKCLGNGKTIHRHVFSSALEGRLCRRRRRRVGAARASENLYNWWDRSSVK